MTNESVFDHSPITLAYTNKLFFLAIFYPHKANLQWKQTGRKNVYIWDINSITMTRNLYNIYHYKNNYAAYLDFVQKTMVCSLYTFLFAIFNVRNS